MHLVSERRLWAPFLFALGESVDSMIGAAQSICALYPRSNGSNNDMKNARALSGLLFIFTFSAVGMASPQKFADSRLTYSGLGSLRIDMTLRDAERAGFKILVDEQFSELGTCGLARVAGYDNVQLLFEANRIARIEIYDGKFATFSGARVGDTESDIRRIYGARVKVEPHKYDPNGHYMIVSSDDKKRALVFETDGKTVTDLRVGRIPAVHYVEHCL